jgi:hypothetical protein
MRLTRTTALRTLIAGLGLLLVACGSETPHVDQASAAALTESSVAVKQTGSAPVSVVDGSVHFRLDDARLLKVSATVHSTAGTAQTVSIRASLYDKSGKLIGDASGGSLDAAPGADTQLELSGPQPNGTVASATFEISTVPSATPIPT